MHAEYAGAPQGPLQHQQRQQEAGWGAFGALQEHHPQQELHHQQAHALADSPFQGGQEGWNSMSGLAGAELQAVAHHGFDQGHMDQTQHPLVMQPPHNQQAQQYHMLESGVPLHQQQGGGDMATSTMPDADVETRKLVVLGLPWETEKETLHQYFAQFGPVQESVIMKDRFTGKSRGFGFVTYVHQADAQNTAALEHQIDGRRCEAKVALPRGGTHPNRTTRIFVARIPPTVQDAQFRSYFEQFGRVQDAYMPKDAFKQAHRGIGFVTYATAEPVEQVMSTAHSLHGQELAVDRATPKEKATLPPSHSSNRLSQQLASAFSPPHSSGNSHQMSPTTLAAYAAAYDSLSSAGLGGPGAGRGLDPRRGSQSPTLSSTTGYSSGGGGVGGAPAGLQNLALQDALQQALAMQGHTDPSVLLSLQGLAGLDMQTNGKVLQALQSLSTFPGPQPNVGMGMPHMSQQQGIRQTLQGFGEPAFPRPSSPSGLLGRQYSGGMGSRGSIRDRASLGGSSSELMSGVQGSPRASMLLNQLARGELNSSLSTIGEHSMAGATSISQAGGSAAGSVSGPADAQAGPRIFVGKLNKDTTEADVRDHFTRFGYVMDVYMPRDKLNRSEHRGFGFVTFETEAALQRVRSQAPHQIKGSVVAIDAAEPRKELEPLHFPDEEVSGMLCHSHLSDMARFALHGDELGPSRHHPFDRQRYNYRPY